MRDLGPWWVNIRCSPYTSLDPSCCDILLDARNQDWKDNAIERCYEAGTDIPPLSVVFLSLGRLLRQSSKRGMKERFKRQGGVTMETLKRPKKVSDTAAISHNTQRYKKRKRGTRRGCCEPVYQADQSRYANAISRSDEANSISLSVRYQKFALRVPIAWLVSPSSSELNRAIQARRRRFFSHSLSAPSNSLRLSHSSFLSTLPGISPLFCLMPRRKKERVE